MCKLRDWPRACNWSPRALQYACGCVVETASAMLWHGSMLGIHIAWPRMAGYAALEYRPSSASVSNCVGMA
eukprot:5707039-Alexandrium_andersonii.AAC.1